MSDEIASHELRNDTAGVLRRVQAGESLAVTVNGRHVADLVPAQRSRREWISRDVIVARLRGRRPIQACAKISRGSPGTPPTIFRRSDDAAPSPALPTPWQILS